MTAGGLTYPTQGFFLGPTIFDRVDPEMSIAREEIFGPVLSTVRVDTIEEAIDLVNRSEYGNGAVLFTQSGKAARQFRRYANAGMIGINIGVPAPVAAFPLAGGKSRSTEPPRQRDWTGSSFIRRRKSSRAAGFDGVETGSARIARQRLVRGDAS